MGCKGSKVRILSHRPVLTGVSRLGLANPFVFSRRIYIKTTTKPQHFLVAVRIVSKWKSDLVYGSPHAHGFCDCQLWRRTDVTRNKTFFFAAAGGTSPSCGTREAVPPPAARSCCACCPPPRYAALAAQCSSCPTSPLDFFWQAVDQVSGKGGLPPLPGTTKLSRSFLHQRGHVPPPVAALYGRRA